MLIAVDTGGTKTLVGRFSPDGVLQATWKFATPTSIPTYITELRKAIHEVAGNDTISMLSIALPGRIIQSGDLVWAGHLPWRNINMRDLLAKYYDCPILIENDANLAGLAETMALQTIPAMSLYVTVSTGIGTGIITNGSIAANLSQSEGGQMLLEHDGVLRTWESFASGSAIKERHGKLARDIHSARSWQQISKNIAQGLIALQPVLHPDIIILGGSIGTYFERYETILRDMLNEYLPTGETPPVLRQAVHPEEAVIYGCYYHAYDSTR